MIREEFQTAVKELRPELIRYAASRLENKHAAEHAVQTALCELWQGYLIYIVTAQPA